MSFDLSRCFCDDLSARLESVSDDELLASDNFGSVILASNCFSSGGLCSALCSTSPADEGLASHDLFFSWGGSLCRSLFLELLLCALLLDEDEGLRELPLVLLLLRLLLNLLLDWLRFCSTIGEAACLHAGEGCRCLEHYLGKIVVTTAALLVLGVANAGGLLICDVQAYGD